MPSQKRIEAAEAARACARVFEEMATRLEDDNQLVSELCELPSKVELALVDHILAVIDAEEGAIVAEAKKVIRLVTP